MADALNDQLVIDDIDSQEADNPQLCTEYAKDIYRYLSELEVSSGTSDTKLFFTEQLHMCDHISSN